MALDPYSVFNITSKAVSPHLVSREQGIEGLPSMPQDKRSVWWQLLRKALLALKDRKHTGSAAAMLLDSIIARAPSSQDVKWALRIIDKDLVCGASLKTANKVLPGLIEAWAVAKAILAEEKHDLSVEGYREPKMDGWRLTVYDGRPMTSGGQEMQGVGKLMEMLGCMVDLGLWVVDGECFAPHNFEDSAGKMAKRGQDDRGLCYTVFDFIDRGEWDRRSTRPLIERKRDLLFNIEPNERIRIIESILMVKGTTFAEMNGVRDKYAAMLYPFEGAIWKRADAGYHWGESPNWLKFKPKDNEDVQVIGTYEGEGAFKGMLGSLHVRRKNGSETDVGGGITIQQRQEWWAIRDQLIDRWCEVDFQNATKAGKLRHPNWVRWRDDR